MKIADVVAALERFAPPELQEEYDNAGLISGSPLEECTGVLCTLDVTLDVLAEAKEKGCNLVVAHHPIVFRGLKKLNGRHYVEQVVITAIRNDIALYAIHTNLDNIVAGVNGKIAAMLGLSKVSILQPKEKMLRRLITFAPADKAEDVRNAVFRAGAGHIGNYSECSFNTEGTGTFRAEEGSNPYVGKQGERHHERETKIEIVYPFFLEYGVVKALEESHPYEEVAYDIFTMNNVHFGIGAGVIGEFREPLEERQFLQLLADTFGARGIRHTALLGKPVRKVAVCGGAGSFLTKNALRLGADAFVTADVKYHEFFEADGKLVLADIGHYESEQFTIDLLHDLLVEKFLNFAVLKSTVNTNPVRYFESNG